MSELQPWEIAHSFLHVPYMHMGRSRRGCDCVGLLCLVEQARGNTPIDVKVYSREPSGETLAKYLELNCGPPLPQEEGYAVNDILLIKFPTHKEASHVGMVAPHPHGLGIIHCYASVGKVVYHRIDERWNRRIVGVYKCPAKQ